MTFPPLQIPRAHNSTTHTETTATFLPFLVPHANVTTVLMAELVILSDQSCLRAPKVQVLGRRRAEDDRDAIFHV